MKMTLNPWERTLCVEDQPEKNLLLLSSRVRKYELQSKRGEEGQTTEKLGDSEVNYHCFTAMRTSWGTGLEEACWQPLVRVGDTAM